jgi:4-hydroxy-tetrahydrodipicolinate reductase
MRLAVIGDGKMGRAVAALAEERGWTVTAVLGASRNAGGSGIDRVQLGRPDVAVEFTEPAAAPANIVACARAGIPVVVGTTGWYAHLDRVAGEVRRLGGGLLYGANFSLGAHLLSLAAAAVGKMLAARDWDVHVVETHHRAKKDAPSGTAAVLADEIAAALGKEVPVTSVRLGHVPGTHEVLFDSDYESLRLVHEVRDRRVFAVGALVAAEWMRGRAGVYTVKDILLESGRHES